MTTNRRLLTAIALCVGTALWSLHTAGAEPDPAGPTEGCLEAVNGDGEGLGACPLQHTEVNVEISGFIARVTLTQMFTNPFEVPIEAVYVFPLSARGAVDSMTMRIGDRTIRGIIKEREEARRIYEAARNAGKAASLLDQERPNIFTQSVANILPGDQIDVTISYVEYLKYERGEYEFAFPMVVGPRYVPGRPTCGGGTDQVPDAGRITPPVTPEGTRSGQDISLTVNLAAGMPVQDVRSELHDIQTEEISDSQVLVRLKNKHEIPNRDFILRYRVAGDGIGQAVIAHTGSKGGFVTLILEPPERVAPDFITPKEMIFVIDCSGSMRGFPIEKAKKTMRLCIENMNPNDTFNLVTFSGGVGYCFEQPVLNTEENRRKALRFLESLEGSGGTEMMAAIRAALENQDDPERLRVVCFMTDGFIGNDMAILDAVQKSAQTARVFSFGIGNGVNRFLLEGMARAGRGAAEVVTLESDADEAARRFHERIHSPVLTDISVDFGGLAVEDVYPDPGAIPDLFAAQPLILTGRYTASGQGTVTVRGNTATGVFERAIPVVLPAEEPAHDVLAPLWARNRIAWLMEQDWLGAQQGRPDPTIKAAVTQLGLDFSLVTQYTSFVAVEDRIINENGVPKTIQVPVDMTDGVSYEGVFGESYGIAGQAVPCATACGAQEQVKALGYVGNAAVGGAFRGRSTVGRPLPPVVTRQILDSIVEPTVEAEPAAQDEAANAKLDPSLRALEAKVVEGSYTDGPVNVRDGWVDVLIVLYGDVEGGLKALKALDVHVVSVAWSGKRVLARVRVADLTAVARLDCVKRVEPPGR